MAGVREHVRQFYHNYRTLDMSGNWFNIYNLCYNNVVLKKIARTFKHCPFRIIFGQKLGQRRPWLKSSSIFFSRWQKEIIGFQELFILSKYHTFWLGYEWISLLYDILLPKPWLFLAETVVYSCLFFVNLKLNITWNHTSSLEF